MADGLLSGLRVIDASLWQPGHTATQLLADLGADVLKVEPPGGDRMRRMPDRFTNYNGRKRSIVLDLKQPEGRSHFLELSRDVDVIVENGRPGAVDRLGVGFDAVRLVNPAIVYCSISGYGQTGPLAGATGHEANYQAIAGAMTFAADGSGPPRPAGMLVGDQGTGMAAAFGILAGVLRARATGEGEHVDISIADLMACWVAPLGLIDERREPVGARASHRSPAMGTFRTADDRWVVLGVFTEDHFWDALCDALDLSDMVGLAFAERSADGTDYGDRIAGAVGARPQAEVLALLGALAVPVSPVLTRAEMLEHPHFRERGTITTGPDGYRSVGHPIRYRIHPALAPGVPPELGRG
ncbi:MAG: CaiB/BaiF CoA transferase family protein [Acidimicrobiia bacterium]